MPSWATVVKRARSQLPESLILGMVRYGALAKPSTSNVSAPTLSRFNR